MLPCKIDYNDVFVFGNRIIIILLLSMKLLLSWQAVTNLIAGALLDVVISKEKVSHDS